MSDNTNSENSTDNVFWLNDPTILFRNGNYYKIVPTSNMTIVQKLNSLTLFFIYLTILYILLCGSTKYIYIPLIAIVIIIFLYFILKKNIQAAPKRKETFINELIIDDDQDNVENINSRALSKNNPFMNITMAELMDENNLNTFDKKITINNDLENIGDKIKQRQFYTMPVTTIPNDQTTFAKWLYQTPETCKENTMNCMRYEDIRYSRSNPTIEKTDSESIQFN